MFTTYQYCKRKTKNEVFYVEFQDCLNFEVLKHRNVSKLMTKLVSIIKFIIIQKI